MEIVTKDQAEEREFAYMIHFAEFGKPIFINRYAQAHENATSGLRNHFLNYTTKRPSVEILCLSEVPCPDHLSDSEFTRGNWNRRPANEKPERELSPLLDWYVPLVEL